MGTRATFVVGTATTRRFPAVSFDVTVAGLALNAAPDEADEVAETIHVTTPRGVVAADVRDDLDGTEMMRAPSAATLDQGHRFPARFNPEAMAALFEGAGLGEREVRTGAITIPTGFREFNHCWIPSLRAQGGGPS